MTDVELHGLVQRLALDLRPVRRLRSPLWRALGWLSLALVAGAALAMVADRAAVLARLAALADLRWAFVGAVLTAVLASFAAFQLSLPDRHGGWAMLPLPAAALWLSASGWGCLVGRRQGFGPPLAAEMMDCLAFIVVVSVPLSAALLLMLRRAHPLRPGLVASMGGLATAAAAAALLTLFHPFDASWTDLLVHFAAVGLVILGNRMAGGRAFG